MKYWRKNFTYTPAINTNSHVQRMCIIIYCLAAQNFLLLLILILSIFLMQELISIFTLSSLTLVNSGTLFLCFFTCLWLKLFLKRSFKTPLMLNWTSTPYFYFSYYPLYKVWQKVGFFFNVILLSLGQYPYNV